MEKLSPKITRLDRDVELVAPPGYHASVLLKLIEDGEGHRYYSWWAMAGRHAADQVSVAYKHTGEEVIRFDLPEGMPLSAASLQPHLTAYLASKQGVVREKTETEIVSPRTSVELLSDDPPIIKD